MLDIVSALAGILGISAKDLIEKLKDIKSGLSEKKLLDRRIKEELYINNKSLSDFSDIYYAKSETSSNLKQYQFKIDGNLVKTSIFCEKNYLRIGKQIDAFNMRLEDDIPVGLTDLNLISKDYGAHVKARLEKQGVEIWNDPLFRMVDFDIDKKIFSFSLTDFISYRFSSGLLEDELVDTLIKIEGAPLKIGLAKKNLLMREVLIPDVSRLGSINSRICGGGIGVVLALKRQKGYEIPIQVRSSKVSDGRNRLAVLPKAFHQPMVNHEAEVHVKWSVFRELFEEIYEGREAERDTKYLAFDWYFDECPGLKWFEDNKDWVIEITAFGLNGVAGNYDFGILFVVDDPSYFELFHRKMKSNWEVKKKETIWVSSLDRNKITDLIINGNWVSESLYHFTEGLIRLKEMHPNSVNLPEIVDLTFQ